MKRILVTFLAVVITTSVLIGVAVVGLIMMAGNQALNSGNNPCLAYENGTAALPGDPNLIPAAVDLDAAKKSVMAGIVAKASDMGYGGNAAAIAVMTAYAEHGLSTGNAAEMSTRGISAPQGVFQQTTSWHSGTQESVFGTDADPRLDPAASAQRFLWAFKDIVSGSKKSRFETPQAINSALETLGVSPSGSPDQRWEQFKRVNMQNVLKPGNKAGMDAFLVLSNAVQGHLTSGGIMSPSNYRHPSAINYMNKYRESSPAVNYLLAGGGNVPLSSSNGTTTTAIPASTSTAGAQEVLLGDSLMTQIMKEPSTPRAAYRSAVVGLSFGSWMDSPVYKNSRTQVAKRTGPITVSFGYNDRNAKLAPKFTQRLDKFMTTVAKGRPVYWYTLHQIQPESPYYTNNINTLYTGYNSALRAAAQKYPNLTILESGQILDRKPTFISPDGLHPSPAGYSMLWDLRQGKADITYTAPTGSAPLPSECLGLYGDMSTQTTIGPDGLPIQVPANALKDGLTQANLQSLGPAAVAGAPTAEAAMAIKWALSHLGVPYACRACQAAGTCSRIGPAYFDCSSFVTTAYRTGAGMGNVPVTTTAFMGRIPGMRSSVFRLIDRRLMQPGDLIVYNTPTGGHTMMYLGRMPAGTNANGEAEESDIEYVTDTGTCGDVSRVKIFDRAGVGSEDPSWVVVRPALKGQQA